MKNRAKGTSTKANRCEKRTFRRINRAFLARYSIHKEESRQQKPDWDMFTLNSLGPEGVSFNYYSKLKRGSLIDLRIAFPAVSASPFNCTGTIIRNGKKHHSSVYFTYKIAAAFTDISNRKKAQLVKGIDEYYKMVNKNAEIPKNIKGDVWMRDRAKCVKCKGRQDLEFHYIFPLTEGGAVVKENIQLVCHHCSTLAT